MQLTGVCGQTDFPSASLKHQSLHSRTRYTHIYAPWNAGITGFCCIGSAADNNNTPRTVLIKPVFFTFTNIVLGVFVYNSRIINKVEAGRCGILRSINIGAMCTAMQRLTFSGGGRLVRLSANACQLHRPNTIPIFCAVVCRDYRLRTYIGFDSKFLLN